MIVDVPAEVIDSSLATKQDIKDIRRDIEELEQRMVIKPGSLLLVAVGAIVGATVALSNLNVI